jgi:hypothetical protein
MTCRKLPILNVYATQVEATKAFTKALEELSFTKFSYKNLVVETEDFVIYFQTCEDAREKLAGQEYWKIYFHCDLQPETHQLYLSRIRYFN